MSLNKNDTMRDATGSVPGKSALKSLHLLYHELVVSKSEYLYAVTTEQFGQHLDFFARLKDSGGLLPELTFDDGHLSDYEHALPMLSARGMEARFFITAGWTGNKAGYMDWPELRVLSAAGQKIGAHGWSHTLLTHCTLTELERELRGTRLLLEDKLGIPITTMSFPGGRFNRKVLFACREAGYTQLYTSIPRAEPLCAGTMIGRLNIRGNTSVEWLGKLFEEGNGTLARMGYVYQAKAAAKSMLGDKLYASLWVLLNRKEPDAEDPRA